MYTTLIYFFNNLQSTILDFRFFTVLFFSIHMLVEVYKTVNTC